MYGEKKQKEKLQQQKKRKKKVIEREGDKGNVILKVKPKEKKDSINTAGCISVVLEFRDSIFLSLPLTHPPL